MPPIYRCLLLALVLGCKRGAEAPPAPSRFCDTDLSGVWLNASDPAFAYRFRDHGDTIRGEFVHRAPDGGLSAPDAPILFELHRTSESLAGVMKSSQATQSGRECPAEFGIQLSACKPDQVQAVVETVIPITEDCQRIVKGPDGGEVKPELREFVFQRDRTHPSGGGEGPVAH